jgi:hypothetical protein
VTIPTTTACATNITGSIRTMNRSRRPIRHPRVSAANALG